MAKNSNTLLKEKRLIVLIDEDMQAFIRQSAKTQDVTVAEYVRRVIAEEMEKAEVAR